MREIKFRAWQNGQMCEIDGNSKVTLCFNKICGWNIAKEPMSDNPYWLMGESSHDAESFVLMQFTGLHDKNGKEVYEGDIVLLPDTESESVDVGDDSVGSISMKVSETSVRTFGTVVFKYGGFCFEIQEGGEIWEKGLTSFHNTDWTNNYRDIDNSDLEKEIEVIGNLYETPELLGSSGVMK